MAIRGAQQQITAQLQQWSGISVAPHRFGGVEYQLGSREIGHIHGDQMVDIPFPTKVRHELVGAGLAQPHHLLHDSGWVSFYIERDEDIAAAIALLQRSYAIAQRQFAQRQPAASKGQIANEENADDEAS